MKKAIWKALVLGLAGSASATIINIPSDWPTIQAGIAYSSDGDTVLVQPGIYYENIEYLGHNVTVGSLFLTTGDTSYISSTVIDGAAYGSVITFMNGEDSGAVLTGFTIQNGYKDNGAGIRCMFNSSPVIKNNVISNNIGYRYCGGIYCLNGSSPVIEDNTIIANSSNLDGGGILVIRSSPLIVNNVIRDNSAGKGGGIFIGDSSSVLIQGNTIASNSAAGLEGGGIGADGAELVIIGNVISGNTAGYEGGAIRGRNSDITIIGCMIDRNTSGSEGGGISLWHSNLNIVNSVISRNTATQFSGGGLFTYYSRPVIYNTVFYHNIARGEGGGVYVAHTRADINNSIFLLNEATWGNYQIGGNPDSAKLNYTDIQGGWPGVGNIDVDPLFRGPEYGDFHLTSVACGDSTDSPCIDIGDPNIFDSLLDCSWGLGGLRSDIGAYGGGDSLITRIFDNPPPVPNRILLLQNYPNPFNAQTTVRFILPEAENVKLAVFDLLGRQVEILANDYMQAGAHNVYFNASDCSSGVYFARLRAGDETKVIRMLLMK